MSIGENNNGRFISISKSGDFSALLEEFGGADGAGAEQINYSQYYDINVPKPRVVSAFYDSDKMTEAEKNEKSAMVNAVVTDQAGIAKDTKIPLLDANSQTAHAPTVALPTWIDSLEGLQALATELNRSIMFAFDCEMHSYRSYQGLTCLLQIAVNEVDYIVDTIALWDHIGPQLGPAFISPAILKIAHATCSMDIPCLYRDFGIVIVNLFDTQIAASTLGARHPPSIGAVLAQYKLLAPHLIENHGSNDMDEFARIKSKYQFNDWRQRPLTEEMMQYAQMDVHYLCEVYRLQMRELIAAAASTIAVSTPSNAVAASSDEEAASAVADIDLDINDEDAKKGDADDSVDWNKRVELDDVVGCDGADDDDEDMWDGWGESDAAPTTNASSSAANNISTTRNHRLNDTNIQNIDREQIMTTSLYSNVHTVLIGSSRACTCLWTDSEEPAVRVSTVQRMPAYLKCGVFKEYKKKHASDDTIERTEFVFAWLFDWRAAEARRRGKFTCACGFSMVKMVLLFSDESLDYICTNQLLLNISVRLPVTLPELSILMSPLPHSMRTNGICAVTGDVLGPVDVVSEVAAKAVEAWQISGAARTAVTEVDS
jgi:hypothetical protein